MRCATCGAEVRSELRVCSQCGANLRRSWLRRSTVRCRACQARVPAGLSICPSCGAPLRRSWRRSFLALVTLVGLEVAAYVLINYVPWEAVRALPGRVHLPSMAFLATPTFTPEPTSTSTPTWTATPTATFTQTPVPPTETPTMPPPTETPRPAPTRTPTPRFGAPRLLGPEDEVEFQGSGSRIELRWESAGLLADDEWYGLGLRFLAGGVIQYGGAWTKETSWIVPGELHARAGQVERAFQWEVTVMKQTGTRSDGGREGVPLGATSETRTFFWY
jgi:hypothetical protein